MGPRLGESRSVRMCSPAEGKHAACYTRPVKSHGEMGDKGEMRGMDARSLQR